MWNETISINFPYDFDRVLDRLSLDPLIELDKEQRWLKVPMVMENERVVVTIQGQGNIDAPMFMISGNNHKEFILKKLSRVFHWDRSLDKVQAHFMNTNLKELFLEHRGTPFVLDFDPYPCLLKCIIHQQLNLSFAHKLTERFVQTFGESIDNVWFYPKAEEISVLSVEELRAMQFSTRKAEYVIGVSKAITDGTLDLASFYNKSDEEVTKELIALRGVGPWTAQNMLMFGYGRPNLFPTADIGIQNALKKLFDMDRKPTLEEMNEWSKAWEPYLSYASLYLWRSIEKTNEERR